MSISRPSSQYLSPIFPFILHFLFSSRLPLPHNPTISLLSYLLSPWPFQFDFCLFLAFFSPFFFLFSYAIFIFPYLSSSSLLPFLCLASAVTFSLPHFSLSPFSRSPQPALFFPVLPPVSAALPPFFPCLRVWGPPVALPAPADMIKRLGPGRDRDPTVRGKNDGKIANGSQFLCVLRGKQGAEDA